MRKTIFMLMAGSMAVGLTSCGGHSADDYTWVGEFQNGYAQATTKSENPKYIFVNEKYEPVTPEFRNLTGFVNGYAVGSSDYGVDSLYVITPDMKVAGYDGITTYKAEPGVNSKGNLWVEKGDNWVLMSLADGKELCEPIEGFEIEQTLDNGNLVLIKRRPNTGLDKVYDYAIYAEDGTALAPFGKYTFVGDFAEGLARYSTNGYVSHDMNNENEKSRWLGNQYGGSRDYNATQGYIDENGDIVIPEKYHYAGDFKDGKAYVSTQTYSGGAFGPKGFYIDHEGNVVE